jgi:hypothetical protein
LPLETRIGVHWLSGEGAEAYTAGDLQVRVADAGVCDANANFRSNHLADNYCCDYQPIARFTYVRRVSRRSSQTLSGQLTDDLDHRSVRDPG